MFQSSHRETEVSFAFDREALSDRNGEYIIQPHTDYPYTVRDAINGRILVDCEVINPMSNPTNEPLEPGTRRGENKSYSTVFTNARWSDLEVLKSWEGTKAHRIDQFGNVLGATRRSLTWRSSSSSSEGGSRKCGVLWISSYNAVLLEPLRLPESYPYGWNEKSSIVGSEKDGVYGELEYPLIWEGNAVRQLPYRPTPLPLPNSVPCGTACAINDSGLAVGSAFSPEMRSKLQRVPVAWVNDQVVQLPTPSGFGEAIAVTPGHIVLGISDHIPVVWDLSAVASGAHPREIKCLSLNNLASVKGYLDLSTHCWIIERKGIISIITPHALCFTSSSKIEGLVDAHTYPLQESFESPGWHVRGVSSDHRLICARTIETEKLWGIFPMPIRRCR